VLDEQREPWPYPSSSPRGQPSTRSRPPGALSALHARGAFLAALSVQTAVTAPSTKRDRITDIGPIRSRTSMFT
jgi:hypothetical protein